MLQAAQPRDAGLGDAHKRPVTDSYGDDENGYEFAVLDPGWKRRRVACCYAIRAIIKEAEHESKELEAPRSICPASSDGSGGGVKVA